MADRGGHPVEWLRGIALSLERLAAQGVASGAVRGAADELRDGLPELPLETWSRSAAEGAVRGAVEEIRRLVPEMQPATQGLLERLKLWLDGSASEAAAHTQEMRAPGDRMRIAAAGAVSGAVEQLSVALPQLGFPAAEFASRVGRGFVRGSAEEVARQLRSAGRSPLLRAVGAGVAIVAVLLAVRRR